MIVNHNNKLLVAEKNNLWYCFEFINTHNLSFWKKFVEYAYQLSDYASTLYRGILNNKDSVEKYRKLLGLTLTDIEEIKKYGEKNLKNGPISHVKGGIAGLSHVLNLIKNEYNLDKIVAIVYISNKEITKRHSLNEDFIDEKFDTFAIDNYKKLFGHIIMSFGFVTTQTSCTTTHFGIFKNPLYLIKKDMRYANLSVLLHSFAAKITLDYINLGVLPIGNGFCNDPKVITGQKLFTINYPMTSMINLFAKSLDKNAISIGTNKDYIKYVVNEKYGKEDIRYKLLIAHPPRLFENINGQYSVTYNNVIKEIYNLNFLPEKYRYAGTSEQLEIQYGAFTLNDNGFAMMTTIALLSLKNVFDK